MTTNRLRRAVAAGALSIAAVGLVAGCGGNDSTASGKPSAATSAPASSARSSAPAGVPGDNGGDAGGEINPEPSEVPATAPPETPEPVPSGFPGPKTTQVTPKQKAFLQALTKQGVDPGQSTDVAISTANYICQATAAKTAPSEINTYVFAIVSTQAQVSDTKIDPQKVADTYIRVAQSDYCNA